MSFNDLTTKKDRTAYIKKRLSESSIWALRGLVRIYDNQTEDEKDTQSTREHNGIGFTGADAEILSSFAEQYKRRGGLYPKQMAILFKIMPKYAKQLEGASTSVQQKLEV